MSRASIAELDTTQVSTLISGNTLTARRPGSAPGAPVPYPSAQQHIFHAPNGAAYIFIEYSKETLFAENFKRQGSWKAFHDRVCYRVTSIDVRPGSEMPCYTLSKEHRRLKIANGDVKKLQPVQRVYNCPTGFERGCGYSWLPLIAAGYVTLGPIIQKICGEEGCGQGGSSGSTLRTTQTAAPSATSTRRRGILSFETYGRSPNGKEPAYRARCGNGTSVRFWRQSNEWWGPLGAIGLSNLSARALAERRCA